MKLPPDDELRWDDLVAQTVLSPNLSKPGTRLKAATLDPVRPPRIGPPDPRFGVASEGPRSAARRDHGGAARAAQGGEVAHTNLDHHVAGALLTPAASYMVMGVMLGVAVVARGLGLPDEGMLEETEPLVN